MRWRRGAAWHRVRHIRGMRDPILQQPDNCWMHWVLSDHTLWLTLVHEFMDMEALAGLRSSCRQAYHKWVVNDESLVRRWLRHALKTYVHTVNNHSWVRYTERNHAFLVLQDDLEPEARELGIAYTRYRIPGCRLSYFHRGDHYSLNRPTLQIHWDEGTRGRRVRLPSREREPSTDSDSYEDQAEQRIWVQAERDQRERDRRQHTWQDWLQQLEQQSRNNDIDSDQEMALEQVNRNNDSDA